MATGGSDLFTEVTEEMFTCDICKEHFDFETGSPRILPCSHSFCETCMKEITKDGSCQFPNCREKFSISKQFPMDTVRVKLMDKRQELQSQGGVSCGGCSKGAKATSRCQDCEEFLCEDCCAAHHKMKKSKDHTLVSVPEVLKNPDKFLITREKCERHSGKNLEVYCVTCSAAACSICAVTLHKDCKKLSDVARIVDNRKKKVMTDMLAELGSLTKPVGEIVPSIQLDTARCGSGCWVGADRCSLSNQPCSHSHSQPQSQSFRFGGTCGTEALPGSSSYWQVRAVATGKPKIKKFGLLCEFGVATQQALQACTGDYNLITSTEHCALTVRIYSFQGRIKAESRYRNHSISTTALAPFSHHSLADLTLGLLLDTDTSRVHVIDVRATRVLCSSAIDLSTPVWASCPCVARGLEWG